MSLLTSIFFYLTLFLIVYIYIIYPLIIYIFPGKRKTKNINHYFPQLTVIIPAYNEEQNIETKVENILSIDYPQELIEVIVGSDNSIDRTNKILTNYNSPRLSYCLFSTKVGKNALINELIGQAKGEIVVVSDADVTINKDALRLLARHFHNPKVGAVCGKRGNRDAGSGRGFLGGALYNIYESFLKRGEGRLLSVIGGDGALYAFRKKLFSTLDLTAPDDLLTILRILAKGYGVVYEPEAVAYEKVSTSIKEDFLRKIRTVARGITGISLFKGLLNPFHHPLTCFQIVSHKILRWLTLLLLCLLLILNLLLIKGTVYSFLLWPQIIFYVLAMLGGIFYLLNLRSNLFYLPFYFLAINLAATLGIVEFLRGRAKASW